MPAKSPWKVLGVSEDCADTKAIKKAYKEKRKLIKSDKELVILRESYQHVKNSILEIENMQLNMGMDTDTAMDTSSMSMGGMEASDEKTWHGNQTNTKTRNFDNQLSNDNCVITDEDFDVDQIFNRMLKNRPSSTSYQTILANNTSLQEQSQEPTPDAFGGFGDTAAAPILYDGTFMFVQGNPTPQHIASGNLDDCDMTKFDEINRKVRGGDGKLDKHQISHYLKMRDTIMTESTPKLSSSEFRNHMNSLEHCRQNAVAFEAQTNSNLIKRQLDRLSADARSRLFSYDTFREKMIEGSNGINKAMESSSPTELKQVADCIFRKPPAPPKTIVLQLTEESSNQFVNDPNASPELEFFTDMARYGVAILFGENCNIANLSRDQFALLQKYMNSMGVALCIKCNADSCDPWDLVEAGGSIEYLRVSVDFI